MKEMIQRRYVEMKCECKKCGKSWVVNNNNNNS